MGSVAQPVQLRRSPYLNRTVHALGTIDDGAAGLVDSLDSLDALGVAHIDEQIAQRQLRKEVVPLPGRRRRRRSYR